MAITSTIPNEGDSQWNLLFKIASNSHSALSPAGGATETTPVQYSATVSNDSVQTADQTVFTLGQGEIGFIQNLDDAALAVRRGAGCTSTHFSYVLQAGTAQDDGKGGAILSDDFIGAVSVAAMSGTARYISWKQSIS